LKKNYYDPNFKGVDIEARFQQADEKIRAATTPGQARSAVAWALAGLDDSHTFFSPPRSTASYDYGWEMDMIGDACFITAVRSKSDADKQGVKSGDEILKLNGYKPTRKDLWNMRYFFNLLQPQPALRLELRSPDGSVRTVSPLARIRQRKHSLETNSDFDYWDLVLEIQNRQLARDPRWVELGDDLMIWHMPDFLITEDIVDGFMSKARQHKALIIDMRTNHGGYVKTENRLLSYFFENDIKVLDRVGRKERAKDLKPEIVKTRGSGKFFTGKLIVLVGSPSASAAEIFARVMQLEKRGIVIGDNTAGAVMESMGYGFELGGGTQSGGGTVITYGASITIADLIMSDGKSLEHAGVTPDVRMLPTAADMAAERDPVLARAAELCGVKLSPEAAGKLFPVRWVNP
jgi:C-terminal processing protease CtpA/Prc